jgi:hypothetical protein
MKLSSSEILDVASRAGGASPSAVTLYDASRMGNNGALTNVTWSQQNKLNGFPNNDLWIPDYGNGGALDAYAEIPDSPSMRFTRGGMILGWIYPRTLGGSNGGRIIHKGSDVLGTNGYRFQVNNVTNVRSLIVSVNNDAVTISNANSIILNSWQFCVVYINSTARKIYSGNAKGFSDVTNIAGGLSLPPNVSSITRIGNQTAAVDRGFDGYISKLRIFTYALDLAQLLHIFESERRLYNV